MTPEQQRAEFDEFTALKMQIHREMFPSGDKIIEAMKAGHRMIRLTLDSAPRFANAAEANRAFQDEVTRRWEAQKAKKTRDAAPRSQSTAGCTSVIGSVSDVQALIDQAYAEGAL
jgi:hypothetical protein